MNYAVIFAGGTGQRMNSKSTPKQFLVIHGKSIICHTIDIFENSNLINGVVIVCYGPYIEYLKEQVKNLNYKKVLDIVPGGNSGQESIFNGLNALAKYSKKDDIVLIHDGVRPLITEKTIEDNINMAKKHGNCITISKATETILIGQDDSIDKILDRNYCYYAKAPQTFVFGDIYDSHLKAREENKLSFIDSAMLMEHYGHKLYMVEGPLTNIKITTQNDYYMYRALLDAIENSQLKEMK